MSASIVSPARQEINCSPAGQVLPVASDPFVASCPQIYPDIARLLEEFTNPQRPLDRLYASSAFRDGAQDRLPDEPETFGPAAGLPIRVYAGEHALKQTGDLSLAHFAFAPRLDIYRPVVTLAADRTSALQFPVRQCHESNIRLRKLGAELDPGSMRYLVPVVTAAANVLKRGWLTQVRFADYKYAAAAWNALIGEVRRQAMKTMKARGVPEGRK